MSPLVKRSASQPLRGFRVWGLGFGVWGLGFAFRGLVDLVGREGLAGEAFDEDPLPHLGALGHLKQLNLCVFINISLGFGVWGLRARPVCAHHRPRGLHIYPRCRLPTHPHPPHPTPHPPHLHPLSPIPQLLTPGPQTWVCSALAAQSTMPADSKPAIFAGFKFVTTSTLRPGLNCSSV